MFGSGVSKTKLSALVWTFLKLSQPTTSLSVSRAKFLSSGAATFFTSVVMASDPENCLVAGMDNPRYVDRELEMKVRVLRRLHSLRKCTIALPQILHFYRTALTNP